MRYASSQHVQSEGEPLQRLALLLIRNEPGPDMKKISKQIQAGIQTE